MKTDLFCGGAISNAAELIKKGGLVAVPTETVYGLAANGLDSDAVERIYEVKGRPETKPLSLMVSGTDEIDKYCTDVPYAARVLAERFWPGPLTIILKADGVVPDIVRAGGATVGLRCPDHPLTLELIRSAELPLAAPSANPSGKPSPKSAQEVASYFDGVIDGIIDGGECSLGFESTIIDMSKTPYRIIREGALSKEKIFAALRDSVNVIGITGGSGCGKSTALRSIEGLGGLAVDCDEIYHRLLVSNADMLSEIDAAFPSVVSAGALDRKKLGQIVFTDEKCLMTLNNITHEYIRSEVSNIITDWALQGGEIAAVEAIALIESPLFGMCDTVVGIEAPRESRIARLMARDSISEEYASLRISAQQPDEYFDEFCDYILYNDGSAEEFRSRCDCFFIEILGGIRYAGK